MQHDNDHFQQKPVRNIEFIRPDNVLRRKVGSGGLSADILSKAQAVIKENSINFLSIGEKYLLGLEEGLKIARNGDYTNNIEPVIATILNPAMQLKANGGMFHYPLVSLIAGRLIQFLEVITEINDDTLEIMDAFYTALRAVIHGQVKGDGGKSGTELYEALNEACYRYFLKKQ
jgi:hypothetical protein